MEAAYPLIPGILALGAGVYLFRTADRERRENERVLGRLIRPSGVRSLDLNYRVGGVVLVALGAVFTGAGILATFVAIVS